MNSHPLLSRILMACLLALALLVPLHLIEAQIGERRALQQHVQEDIAHSSAGPQTLSGPYLLIRYRVRLHKTVKDKDGNDKSIVTELGPREKLIAPNTLEINGAAGVETHWRGIYQAQIFNLESTVSGDFILPPNYGIDAPPQDIILDSASIAVGISDSRGVLNTPVLTLNGEKREFLPGSGSTVLGNGMHARLQLDDPSQPHAYRFEFPLNLRGMSTLAVSPAGNSTHMLLKSTWPHPSFGGDFLPRTPAVDKHGFTAEWSVSNLARNAAEPGEAQRAADREVFSVGFINPVNIYLMAERAVKYGILFIVLVFTAFFMLEIMRRLRIHPMQYLLVGLALAMFFLLLISLSEHIPFLAAYVISGAACVTLIGVYLAGVLRHSRSATGFSAGIALLYAVLYGVLKSEDNALLMGTLILFAALAAVMTLTRHMDWYRIGNASAE